MRSETPQALGSVLSGVIDKLGLQKKIDQTKAIEAWAIMAGPQVNNVTSSAWMKGGVLYIKITSSAWRHQLHLQRKSWCRRLNEQLGKEFVREIVFR